MAKKKLAQLLEWSNSETNSPTNRFTILEARDQEIDEFYFVQERRPTDFEAPKLGKGSSGLST